MTKIKNNKRTPGLEIADLFRITNPEICTVNDSDQAKTPEYFATWSKGQWNRFRISDIKATLHQAVEDMFPAHRQSIIVEEAYRIIKFRAEFTLDSEWNVSKESIPLADGNKSLCLRTGDVIATPKQHMMLCRLPLDSETLATTSITETRFYKFMHDWFPDPDRHRFVKRFFGQCLAGNPSRSFVDFFGSGVNGKGTLQEFVHASFGDYSGILDKNYLTLNGSSKHESGLLKLAYKRYLINGKEFNNRDILDEGAVNSISAGDRDESSEKGGRVKEIRSRCGLAIHSNTKLNISADSDGLRSRWKTVLCNFTVPDDIKIESDEMDRIIAAEGPLALIYWIEGLKEYRREKFGDLGQVKLDTDEYFDEEDRIMHLLDEYCIKDNVSKAYVADIWRGMKVMQDKSFKSPTDIRKRTQTGPHKGKFKKDSSNRWYFNGYRVKPIDELGTG